MLIRNVAKKILYSCLLIFSITIFAIKTFAASDDFEVKRVLSLVYDDSFSMIQNGQDYYYANYTLQNIVGMMNDTDELNVVYLSNENTNNMKNMTNVLSRKNYISELKTYSQYASDTNFDAVRTAADYLKDKKSLYGNDNTYKYYLVVLTDGIFKNAPNDLSKYLSDLRSEFIGGYFKGVFVGIGDNINRSFVKEVLKNDDYYYVESKGNQDIVKAVFEAHDIIYNRDTLKEEDITLVNNNQTLLFTADKNVNRIIVLEQNQNAKVVDITSGTREMDKLIDFRCDKMSKPYLSSVITHTNSSGGPIPKGLIKIDFDGPVSKSYEKTRVLVEYTDAEASDSIVKATSKNNDEDEKADTTNRIIDEENNNGPNENNGIDGNNKLDGSKELLPHSFYHGFCICPILRILLLIFLIGLIKALRDRKRNFDTQNNIENSEKNVYKDYYAKRIRTFSILIILVIIFIILCHIFWCRLSMIDCAKYCWEFLSGCACVKGVPFISRLMPVNTHISGSPTVPMTPITPNPIVPNTPNPVTPNTPKLNIPNIPKLPLQSPNINDPLSFLGLLLVFGLILGYLFKNRLDTKNHGFELKDGDNEPINIHAMKVNGVSKFIPYVSESGMVKDLQIKAAKEKDRVIIPQGFLTNDMKCQGENIDTTRDFTLFEDVELTKMVGDKKVTYVYKNYPDKGINV